MKFLFIFCYILCAYGIANMFAYAEGPWGIFEWWRAVAHNIGENFGKLFTCMMCFSTWIGLFFSGIDLLFKSFAFTPFNILLGAVAPWWLILILDAGFTSGIVWLLHNFEEACERHGTVEYEDDELDELE